MKACVAPSSVFPAWLAPFRRQVSGRWKADDEAERALARELVSLRACAAAAASGTSVWEEGQVRLAGSHLPSPS